MTTNDKFLDATSFSVYYGKGCLNELGKFDIAVIEPMSQDFAAIRELQKKGVIVFAYLSIVEVRPDQNEFHLHKDDLLKVEGEYVMNHEFHTYYADLRSEEWRSHLCRKAEIYLTEYGCDGLFLDTIGNLEDFRIPVNMKYVFIETAVALLEKIKKDFNGPLILQNNGLGLLLQYTKHYIDGVCWENIRLKHGVIGKINKVIVKKLKTLQTEINMKVFLLTVESKQCRKITKFADQNNFLYYDAPEDYMRI